MGVQMTAINLTMACRDPISTFVGLLILCSKNMVSLY